MKKKVLSVLLAAAMMASLAACAAAPAAAPAPAAPAGDSGEAAAAEAPAEEAGELVDGKFAETRTITVEIYDRGNDGGSDPENNDYTRWIQQQMLEKHNVEVKYQKVPRWTEVDDINNLLAAGTAPDVCVTYSYPTVQTYADMGGVIDLAPYLETYKDELPNLWNWLGETNLYWDRDPSTGNVWAVEAKLANMNRVVTFIRQDWLDA